MEKEKLEHKDSRFKKIQITVDAYLPVIIDEEGFKQGLLTFKSFTTDVLEDDEIVGTIGGGLGAVTLSNRGDEALGEWQIHHDDLWYAFQEALNEVD
ncbi:MAG: hypothetical protein ACXABY_02595 [Candidatus Thorarchaeota archaeon]|jgi:hypothetical protein